LIVTKENDSFYPDTAEVLRKAFAEDPVHHWMFQRDFEQYEAFLFNYVIDRVGLKQSKGVIRIATNNENKVCSTSLWFDSEVPGLYEYLGLCSLALWYPSSLYRLLYLDAQTAPAHKRNMGNRPHWYLCLLGTDPEQEGKGFASKLMRDQLAIADKEQKEVYLESSTEKNIPFYERFGFELIETLQSGDMPPLYAMKRNPQA